MDIASKLRSGQRIGKKDFDQLSSRRDLQSQIYDVIYEKVPYHISNEYIQRVVHFFTDIPPLFTKLDDIDLSFITNMLMLLNVLPRPPAQLPSYSASRYYSSPDYEKIIDLQIKYIKPFQENISSNGITDKDLNNANDFFKCLHKQDTNNLLVTRTLNKLGGIKYCHMYDCNKPNSTTLDTEDISELSQYLKKIIKDNRYDCDPKFIRAWLRLANFPQKSKDSNGAFSDLLRAKAKIFQDAIRFHLYIALIIATLGVLAVCLQFSLAILYPIGCLSTLYSLYIVGCNFNDLIHTYSGHFILLVSFIAGINVALYLGGIITVSALASFAFLLPLLAVNFQKVNYHTSRKNQSYPTQILESLELCSMFQYNEKTNTFSIKSQIANTLGRDHLSYLVDRCCF